MAETFLVELFLTGRCSNGLVLEFIKTVSFHIVIHFINKLKSIHANNMSWQLKCLEKLVSFGVEFWATILFWVLFWVKFFFVHKHLPVTDKAEYPSPPSHVSIPVKG